MAERRTPEGYSRYGDRSGPMPPEGQGHYGGYPGTEGGHGGNGYAAGMEKSWPEITGVKGETEAVSGRDRRKKTEKPQKRDRKSEKKTAVPKAGGETPGMAKNMEEVAAVLKRMKFRKKLFGGVDELDVWRQLEKLQKEYRSAYEAEQERSKALIRERDTQISQLKRLLTRGNYGRGANNAQKQKDTQQR